MDQLETTTARLLRQVEGRPDLAALLGEVLRYPVSDIPTVEDLEREQGQLGIPTEAQQSRQTGQEVLDWLTQAVGIAGLLRGSAAGRQQELMGKQRGVETFGKEMMDTSRRAQPRRWREMQQESVDKTIEGRQRAYEEGGYAAVERPPEDMAPFYGRKEWRDRQGGMPPQERMGRRDLGAYGGLDRPADVVRSLGNHYAVGTPIELPNGTMVNYSVRPAPGGYKVMLDYQTLGGPQQGIRRFEQGTYSSIGEATAKARQLQNRLDLAAKDLQQGGWMTLPPTVAKGERRLRLPWEGTTQPQVWDPDRSPYPGGWRRYYTDPGER